MPTQVSDRTRQIATAELERLQKAEAELKAIRKKEGPPMRAIGQLRLSKFRDYQAYITFFKMDEAGNPIKDEKGYYIFDADMKKLFLNTAVIGDLLHGRTWFVDVAEQVEE